MSIIGIVMLVINVLVLLALAFAIGYYLGKGKIVIKQELSVDQTKEILKKQEEAMENIEQHKQDMDALLSGGKK